MLWWLAGLNVAVFAVLTIGGVFSPRAALWLAMPGNAGAWIREPWTALTYMVAHVDFLHLLFNVLWLLWFGGLLAGVVSQRRLLWLYVGGGLAGAAVFMLACGAIGPVGGDPRLIGASASVLAVMTAAGCLMPSYRLHLFFAGDVKLKWIVIVMILLSFLGAGGGSTGGGMAHVGGVLYGVAWSLWSMRRSGRKRSGEVRRNAPAHPRPTVTGARRVASILEQNRLDRIRLDQLLDKIRVSGYESLTRAERRELDTISKRIGK